MKPLAIYDVESTGVDIGTAKVVQVVVMPLDGTDPLNLLVNPGEPIPEEASAVHGITDEDVVGAPSFADVAPVIQAKLTSYQLVGYNCRRFDSRILDRELKQAGQPGLDLQNLDEIDVYRIWQELEPRTLEGAAERFGVSLDEVKLHDALDDCRVTAGVLDAIRHKWGELGEPLCDDELVLLSKPHGEIDRDGKFVRSDDGRIRFAHGKHKGRPVQDHLDYVKWMLKEGAVCQEALEELAIEHGSDLVQFIDAVKASRAPWEVDLAGKLRREDDGRIVFGFGKHRGEGVLAHRDYLEWMLGGDFQAETKERIREILKPSCTG